MFARALFATIAGVGLCLAAVSADAEAQVFEKSADAVAKAAQAVGQATGLTKLFSIMKQPLPKVRLPFLGSGIDKIAESLPPPKGHCPLPLAELGGFRAKLGEVFGKDVEVVQFSVPCDALADYWQGNSPRRWAIYTLGKTPLPAKARRTDLVVELTKDAATVKLAALRDLAKKRPVAERSGLLESSPDAVYRASVGPDEAGNPIAHVGGATLISERVLGVELYAEYGGAKTFDELVATVKDVVARSIEVSERR